MLNELFALDKQRRANVAEWAHVDVTPSMVDRGAQIKALTLHNHLYADMSPLPDCKLNDDASLAQFFGSVARQSE